MQTTKLFVSLHIDNNSYMITITEYRSAVHVIEKFHDQINRDIKDQSKTRIREWNLLSKCSKRLQNGLISMVDCKYRSILYIEDVTKIEFLKTRGLGKKTWIEFEKLR